MRVLTLMGVWVDVYGHTTQAGQLVQQPVADLLSDPVTPGHREFPVHVDVELGVQAVAGPSGAHARDVLDAFDRRGDLLDDFHRRLVDAVHGAM